MKKRFFRLLSLLIIFSGFVACGNMSNTVELERPKDKKELQTAPTSNTAQLVFSLSYSARTALPQIDVTNLKNFKIYYRETGDGEYAFFDSWKDYDTLTDAIADFELGTFDFKLCAELEGLIYSDEKLNVEVAAGRNNLSFSLHLTGVDFTSGEGSFEVTLEWQESSNAVNAVTATLLTRTNEPIEGFSEESLTIKNNNTAV